MMPAEQSSGRGDLMAKIVVRVRTRSNGKFRAILDQPANLPKRKRRADGNTPKDALKNLGNKLKQQKMSLPVDWWALLRLGCGSRTDRC
jgi:hypothetical protein